jgi:hypothetical protein
MKKMLAVAIMGLVASTIAVGGTLSVPFFLDNADTFPPADGTQFTFVGVKNTTDAALTVTIQYWDDAGNELTPDPNTFVVGAQQGLGFLPAGDQPAIEAEEVPNITSGDAGSLLMTFMGNRGDLQGRVLTIEPNGQSAYLMPTGPEA